MCLVRQLDDSVAAAWRRELVEGNQKRRRRWHTKVAFYQAVRDLVGSTGRAPSAEQLQAYLGYQSKSNFYRVAGASEESTLVHAYLHADCPTATELAATMTRTAPDEYLVGEAKVWHFWPYRVGWVRQLARGDCVPPARAAEALINVIATWANRHRELAGVLEHVPPICAVEDLLTLHHGTLEVESGTALLREVIRSALGPSGTVPLGVLTAFRGRRAAGGQLPRAALDPLVQLVMSLETLAYDRASTGGSPAELSMLEDAVAVALQEEGASDG